MINLLQFPQFDIPINLGFTKIQFSLQDLKFKEMYLDQIDLQFKEDRPLQAIASNISAIVSFKWKFQQQSAPYISDSGTGQIIMQNIQVVVILTSQINDKCWGKLKINIQDISFEAQSLSLKLSGGNSWIYESIMKFALNELQDSINDMIGDQIAQTIVQFINPSLEKSLTGFYSQYSDKLFQDNSYTTNIITGFQWMAIGFHGQILDTQNLLQPDYIFNNSLQRKLPIINKLNNDLAIQVTSTTFNSVVNSYLKYGAFQIPNNQIENIFIEICNTGLKVNIKTSRYKNIIQLKGDIIVKQIKSGIDPTTQQQKNGTAFIINLQNQWLNYYQFDQNEQEQIQQQLNNMVQILNKQLQVASFFIASTPFMTWENQPIYDPFDDVVIIYLDFNK